jgi:organic hydroperoxide reductase OsmC/OhrA
MCKYKGCNQSQLDLDLHFQNHPVMAKDHHYKATIEWTGNKGTGTGHYRNYDRSHLIHINGKEIIQGSSDPAFLGDATKHNPEDLLLASLSACHLLWYLHLCSAAGVVVVAYTDDATGTMVETADGGGHFTEATLHPKVTVSHADMIEQANALHHKANQLCFIANSVKFPVHHQPQAIVAI